MLARLLLLFTIVPIIELSLLITLGTRIGLVPTIGIVLTTALLGALLLRYQGANAWGRIKTQLEHGELPGDSLLDGLAILVAGAFLVTPGVLTDVTAFMLLIPFTRAPVKALVRKRLDRWLKSQNMGFMTFDPGDERDISGFDMYADHGRARGDDIVIDPEPDATTEREAEETKAQAEVIIEPAPATQESSADGDTSQPTSATVIELPINRSSG